MIQVNKYITFSDSVNNDFCLKYEIIKVIESVVYVQFSELPRLIQTLRSLTRNEMLKELILKGLSV